MHKTLAAALACLLAAACGGGSPDLQSQSRNALPQSSSIKMKDPKATGSTKDGSDGQLQQDSTVGGSSDYFNATVNLSAIVNVSAAAVLGIVEAIVSYPATKCDDATKTCTWGPFSGGALDANNYMLVVIKQGDGSFKYELSGESKADTSGHFVTFLSGTAIPSGNPHVGSGEIVIDNDARATLPGGNGDTGKITIDYSNTSQLSISATATGVKDNDHPGQKLNVAYVYGNHADGGGDLDVAFRNLTSNATLSLHSRWQATGAGRGDATFTLNTITVHASECWAAAASGFTLGFLDGPNGTQGNASACVFASASYGTTPAP